MKKCPNCQEQRYNDKCTHCDVPTVPVPTLSKEWLSRSVKQKPPVEIVMLTLLLFAITGIFFNALF